MENEPKRRKLDEPQVADPPVVPVAPVVMVPSSSMPAVEQVSTVVELTAPVHEVGQEAGAGQAAAADAGAGTSVEVGAGEVGAGEVGAGNAGAGEAGAVGAGEGGAVGAADLFASDSEDNDYEAGADESDDGWQDDLLEELLDSLDYKGDVSDEGDPLITIDKTEAKQVRNDLYELGQIMFTAKYLLSGEWTAAKLLAALGFRLPLPVIDQYKENQLQVVLQVAIRHVLNKRQRLDNPRTLDEVVDLIAKANNIIVLTGAGISTSLGIPDFRSDNGLYSQLKHLGLTDPQEVFDIRLFRDDPKIFYSVARKVLPEASKFSPTHQFIKVLYDHGKLLRNYTQNIDNLERSTGLPEDKIVQCHGSFGTARCISCGKSVPGESLYESIRAGEVPKCPDCEKKRKRMENNEDGFDESFGVFKPDITFFGESLPDRFDEMLLKQGDAKNCDLLICMGTSLKVAPVSNVVKLINRDIPQIYISKTPASHLNFDVSFLGPCDDAVELLTAKLGWKLDHPMAHRAEDLADDEYPDGKIFVDDGNYTFESHEAIRANAAAAAAAVEARAEAAVETAIDAAAVAAAEAAVDADASEGASGSGAFSEASEAAPEPKEASSAPPAAAAAAPKEASSRLPTLQELMDQDGDEEEEALLTEGSLSDEDSDEDSEGDDGFGGSDEE